MLLISILLPLVGGAALFLWRPRSLKACHALTFAFTLLASLCVAWCVLTPGSHHLTLLRLSPMLTISFKLDGLGRVFSSLVAFLWPLSTLYAFEYMEHEGGENTFFGFYQLSYAVTLAIAFAEDLMTLYIFYELLTLATLFLVMHGMKAKRVYAGRKYVYYSLGGAAMAFLTLVVVMHYSNTSNFMPGGIPLLSKAPMELLTVMFVLGFLGFGVKAAVFPFHDWLPTAGVAPTPVTALLHAVAVVKAGAFAVIRMSYYCFNPSMMRGTWAQYVCLTLAMLSILIGSGMAVREQHLKRRLAYSTMSNLSYVLLGAMLLTPQGLQGGLLHMIYHALMKISLFSCVGAIMVKTGKSYVEDLRGLNRRMPVTMAMFLFCGIELVGIPPFIGFQSKWQLATAALSTGTGMGVAAVVVLLLSAILTAVYMLVPGLSAYALPLAPGCGLEERSYDPGWRMLAPLALLLLVMLVLAFASAPLAEYLGQVALGLV